LARLSGIKAQIGYKRRPCKYGGKPSVVVDNTLNLQFDVMHPTGSAFSVMRIRYCMPTADANRARWPTHGLCDNLRAQ